MTGAGLWLCEKLERKLSSAVIKWRNHPSVVLWYLSGNQLGYAWDYHPLKQADGYLPSFKNEFADICLETAKLLDKYDGTIKHPNQEEGKGVWKGRILRLEWMASRAGIEPATSCLEGPFG